MKKTMYATTGGFLSKPGKRDELISTLLQAASLVSEFDGCQAYVVCEDFLNPDGVAVFEVLDSREAHDASLRDNRIISLISAARPLLGGINLSAELKVKGGHGI